VAPDPELEAAEAAVLAAELEMRRHKQRIADAVNSPLFAGKSLADIEKTAGGVGARVADKLAAATATLATVRARALAAQAESIVALASEATQAA